MSKHYYLDISLKLHTSLQYEITPEYFKHGIVVAVNQLFGEFISSQDIDVLKYNKTTKRAILRVPVENYVKVRSSLTLCGTHQGDPASYIVHKASPLLLNLQGDSRDYKF